MSKRKTYKVNAPGAVCGHAPGTVFSGELDPVLERRLLDSGALKLAEPGETSPAEGQKPKGPTTPPNTEKVQKEAK